MCRAVRSVGLPQQGLPARWAGDMPECRASRSSVMVYLACGYCGEEFMRKRGGTRQGAKPFCSVACRNLGIHEGKLSRHRLCEVCETPYYASYTEQRTCGRECGKAIRQAKEPSTWPSCRIHVGHCQQCGEAFTSRTPLRTTCSRRCSDRLYNVTARRPSPPSAPHQCMGCGETISNRRNKCDPCLTETVAARKQRERRARRARKLGVPSEPYTLAEIAARDRFRCGICRSKVDMARVFPHPEAPTVDHIVPLARGGDDMRANLQLAHFLCNSRKSDGGGGEQLALVG
jgi:hypothetical protein